MVLFKKFGRFMTNGEVRIIAKTWTSVIYLVTDKLTVECNIVFYDYDSNSIVTKPKKKNLFQARFTVHCTSGIRSPPSSYLDKG